MKICSACNLEKDLDSFYFDKSKSKHYSKCKVCYCGSTKESKFSSYWYIENFSAEELELFSVLKNLCTKAKLRKNKEFDPEVTWEYLFQLWESQNGKCAYSGLPLSSEMNHPHKVSLDRIDSERGYLVGNLQLVSATVNRMKQDLKEDVFVEMCVYVANNIDRKTT